MFACVCPHVGEEIWQLLGHDDVIVYEKWPTYDESKIQLDTVKVAVSVNGKLRATIEVKKDLSDEEIKELAFAQDGVKRHTEGKEIKKVIVVKNKIVNIVAI